MKFALISLELATELKGRMYAQNSYCNPVVDGLGRWVISLEEAEALDVQYEVVEWIEPVNDGLEF